MRPQQGSDTIQIPITFDSRGGSRIAEAGKKVWLLLLAIGWIFTSVISLIISDTWVGYMYTPVSLFVISYVVRFLILRERYYRAKRKELVENEYMFNHSMFWNIYEVSSRYPYIASFGNGMKGIFIALDKDVIVGKDDDYDYFHHEAIANAYQQMEKRGIEAIHIDYMDTVGKDDRMKSLFAQAEKTENEDLRKVLMRMYDHIEYKMNKTYASYDVYCFYAFARDDLFWDELQIVLEYFGQANYIRARALDRDDISTLVESVMNITEFSVNRANDTMFREMNKHIEYIRPIWVEKDGEKEELNKTLDEIQEVKRVTKAERKVKRKGRRFVKGLFKKKVVEEDIDLFK